jgi:uncharacterized protein
MPRFTRSFLFPDINVWIALTYQGHVHHLAATDWFDTVDAGSRLFFCRFTQLGLLRLLTARAVMDEEVMNQEEAWAIYDRWLQDDRVNLMDEPPGLEDHFRAASRSRNAAPKDWGDSYLAAFAKSAQVTLVTFDRAFKARTRPVILLSE